MDFTIGTLQMTRTDPAHIGTAPLTGTSRDSAVGGAQKNKGSFEAYLLEAMDAMNGQQVAVSKMPETILTAQDDIDIHDVTTAMAKAQMSLNLAQTVIDRLISGWNELSTTR